MKKKITQSYIFYYSLTKMCFLLHIVFPVRWLRALFHNHESSPTISVSREGGKVCFCHLATFNRKEKTQYMHTSYTLNFFFSPQCKLLGPPVNFQAQPRSQSSLLPVNGYERELGDEVGARQ